jgi:hypothetical protein
MGGLLHLANRGDPILDIVTGATRRRELFGPTTLVFHTAAISEPLPEGVEGPTNEEAGNRRPGDQ